MTTFMAAFNCSIKIPAAHAAYELSNYGRLMDLMETGRISVSARQYRKAAVYATNIIDTYFAEDFVHDTCACSPALAGLRDNLLIESDVHGGRLTWCVDFRSLVSRA